MIRHVIMKVLGLFLFVSCALMQRLPLSILVAMITWIAASAGTPGRPAPVVSSTVITERILNINRIGIWMNDRGYLNNTLNNTQWFGGVVWPDTGLYPYQYPVVYDHGPWIIGKLGGVPSAAMSLWKSSFAPGPVINSKPALWVRPEDSSRYHPYKISYNSSSADSDFTSWPKDLGAPVDAQGKPQLLGDQLVWSVFNGADTSALPVNFQSPGRQFPHLPVEVRQAVYEQKAAGDTDTSLLANTAFLEYTLINKGSATIESCYVGFWSDIDFQNVENNVPGVDTTLQLGYCWAPDSDYTTEAVGYQLLYGPVTPEPGRSAVFCGNPLAGYRNMPLSSFWGILDDVGHTFYSAPTTITESWNVARGYDLAGETIIDSVSKLPTHFPYSGDPVAKTGWYFSVPYRKNSAGILMFAGPFNLAASDSQWMMLALIPANAGERLASISLLRNNAHRLRALSYDQIAHLRMLGVQEIPQSIPRVFALAQNYPNPFNPTTTIRYSLPHRSHVTLAIFNTLGQQVAQLVNSDIDAGYHEIQFNANNLASGVYFYRIEAGSYVESRKLVYVR